MKNCSHFAILTLLSAALSLQKVAANNGPVLAQNFPDLAQKWQQVSKEVSTYTGLKKFCASSEYRSNLDNILEKIHLYDSVLCISIKQHAGLYDGRKLRKALKSVEDFEEKYKAYQLTQHLNGECFSQKKMERHYRKTKNNTGLHSYDNGVIVTEVYLRRYVKNIDKLMAHIERHLHFLAAGGE